MLKYNDFFVFILFNSGILPAIDLLGWNGLVGVSFFAILNLAWTRIKSNGGCLQVLGLTSLFRRFIGLIIEVHE